MNNITENQLVEVIGGTATQNPTASATSSTLAWLGDVANYVSAGALRELMRHYNN